MVGICVAMLAEAVGGHGSDPRLGTRRGQSQCSPSHPLGRVWALKRCERGHTVPAVTPVRAQAVSVLDTGRPGPPRAHRLRQRCHGDGSRPAAVFLLRSVRVPNGGVWKGNIACDTPTKPSPTVPNYQKCLYWAIRMAAVSPLPTLVRQRVKFSATYMEFTLIICKWKNFTPTEKRNSCKKDQCTSLFFAQFLVILLIPPYFISSFSLELWQWMLRR